MMTACTPGAVTNRLGKTPDIPDQEKCDPTALNNILSPLVFDWPTSTRGDLEDAMSQGVVVVNFSCQGAKVLPDCKVEGGYGYRAVTPKTEQNLIEGKDNIRASFGGVVAGVSAQMDRESKLDMSYVLVGKSSTPRGRVSTADLQGDDFCKGATHFVKRADVGAWTMVTGKNVKAGVAARIMTQGAETASSSKEVRSKTDGNPKSCNGAKKGDSSAPSGCQSLIRVSLAPIKKSAKGAVSISKSGGDDGIGCPKGFVSAHGTCQQKAQVKGAFLCKRGDDKGCAEQCKKGSDGSCNRLATSLLYSNMGSNGSSAKEDRARMKRSVTILGPLKKRLNDACFKGDQGASCMGLAFVGFVAARSIRDEAEQMKVFGRLAGAVLKGCESGDFRSCAMARQFMVQNPDTAAGLKGTFPSPAKAYIAAIGRGCKGGNAAPCGFLAFELADGSVIQGKAAAAPEIAHKACLGDFAEACLLEAALSDGAACKKLYGQLERTVKESFSRSQVCEAATTLPDNTGVAKKAKARACLLGSC